MPAIHDLLADDKRMALLQELVEIGASIATVEAKLSLPPGLLTKWLAKGKIKPRSPYRQLYMLYRSYAAEARAVAESTQLSKAPGAWLEKNTSSKLVEPVEESAADLPTITQQTNNNNLGAQAVLAALACLQESGVDINEALRKNQVQLAIPKKDTPQ